MLRLRFLAIVALIFMPAAAYSQSSRTAGLVNAMSYTCGIPIGDGQVHTVGTAPAGSCFGNVTSLAQLAAIKINGQMPFSFLTDNGTVTGPLATWNGTVNPFTSPTGAYRLKDASVPDIDIAWLAIQASALTGGSYLPAGNYLVGSNMPLPIMLINHFDDFDVHSGPAVMFLGDGSGRTIITAGSSFRVLPDGRTNIPLMACGDPGATPANRLGRWYPNKGQCFGTLQGVLLWGDPAVTRNGLASTYRTDGLALGARLATMDVQASHFYNDLTLTGDHTLHIRLKAAGGVFGAYWTAPNTILTGDLTFLDFNVSGQSFASLRVDGAASITGSTFEGETYLNAAYYAIFGDANGCSPILHSTRFSHLMTEFLGLAVIHDEHVFNAAAGTYTDSNKCRGVDGLRVDYWFNQFKNNVIPSGTNRRRRAVIDASELSGIIAGIDTAGGGIVPIADNIGPAGVASFNVNHQGDSSTGTGLTLSGNMFSTFHTAATAGAGGAAVPIITTAPGSMRGVPAGGATWEVPGFATGYFSRFMAHGNRGVTSIGDLLQAGPAPALVELCCTASNPEGGVAGAAAMANVTAGQVVPVQTGGVAQIKLGWHAGAAAQVTTATGVGPKPVIAAGIGGSTGTYIFTAIGGGCTTAPVGTITVANGGITNVALTEMGSGCTGIPTVQIPPTTGLSGASVILQWPGGVGQMASTENPSPGPLFGTFLGARGSATSGNLMVYARLEGMQ